MKRVVSTLLVLPLLALSACGNKSNSAGAAKLVPADASAFVRVQLDPSKSQEAGILKLAKLNPEYKDVDSFDELIASAAKSDDDKEELNQIKSWIGGEIDLSVTRKADNKELTIGYIESKDNDKAQDFLNDKKKDDKDNVGRVIDDWVVFTSPSDFCDDADYSCYEGSPTPAATAKANKYLDKIENLDSDDSLDSKDGFQSTMDLAEGGLVQGYVDTKKAISDPSGDQESNKIVECLNSSGGALGTVGNAMAIKGDASEDVTTFDLIAKTEEDSGSAGDLNMIGSLPNDSVFALSVNDLGSAMKKIAACALKQQGTSLDALSAQLGLNVNSDLFGVFSRETALVLAGTEAAPKVGLIADLKSKDSANKLLSLLPTLLQSQAGIGANIKDNGDGTYNLTTPTDEAKFGVKNGRLAIASPPSYFDELTTPVDANQLKNTTAYKTLLGDSAKGKVAFLVTPEYLKFAGTTGSDATAQALLNSFVGASALTSQDGDVNKAEFRIAFD